ncbi:hypothetical protein DCAR_0934605 [Daucus carota subsp. sativus]|uniref:Uncharacterized protein n=1 Tax=Daucus carota subsp. sativus TaxID=79200 RepID=A0AAF0XW34_DAUCS|nr:hypothetical protein DCAR_0934605 [Daucus carota subsp. sativus]
MHKSRFKAEYYSKYDNDEERLRNRPQSIPLEKFKILLQYWGHEKIKSTAAKNSNNRRKVIDTHTAGRKSFAQIGNEMKKNQSTPDTPTKADIYPKTRQGHDKKIIMNVEYVHAAILGPLLKRTLRRTMKRTMKRTMTKTLRKTMRLKKQQIQKK